jgi:hypothetical protein
MKQYLKDFLILGPFVVLYLYIVSSAVNAWIGPR